MRRLSLCMWTILALLLLAAHGSGQEQKWATGSSWLPGWLTFAAKAASKPPAPPPAVAILQMNPKDAANYRRAEEQTWLRRAGVCDKLRQLALQTGDGELLRKADYLDQRAWETYQKKTGQNLPSPAVAVQNDINYIDQYLQKQGGGVPNFAARPVERRVRANLEVEP